MNNFNELTWRIGIDRCSLGLKPVSASTVEIEPFELQSSSEDCVMLFPDELKLK